MNEKPLYVESEEVVQKTKTQKVFVDIDFSLTFDNRFKYTSRLRSIWSVKYFDWLCTQADRENELNIGIVSFNKFKNELIKLNVAPPSPRTMKDVMHELVEEHLIIRIGRGRYLLNPMIIWKEQSKKRVESIKILVSNGILVGPNVEPVPQAEEENTANPSLPSSRDEDGAEVLRAEDIVDSIESAENKEII